MLKSTGDVIIVTYSNKLSYNAMIPRAVPTRHFVLKHRLEYINKKIKFSHVTTRVVLDTLTISRVFSATSWYLML